MSRSRTAGSGTLLGVWAVLLCLLVTAVVAAGSAAATAGGGPTLTLQPASAAPGTEVRLEGSGYLELPDGGGTCSVRIDGQPADGATCDFEGRRLVGSLTVPPQASPGTVTVSVCRGPCTLGNAATQQLEVLRAPATVPDLTGATLEEAEAELKEVELALGEVSGEGVVTSQDPAPFTEVPRGSSVSVDLAPAAPVQVEVPDLSGDTPDEAAAELEDAGLQLGRVTGTGIVTAQRPAARELADRGSSVDVTLEPVVVPVDEVPVPDLDGLTREQAAAALTGVGLALGQVEGEGRVSSQSPAAGRPARKGSEVSVVLRAQPSVERVRVPDLARMTREQAVQALGAVTLLLGAVSGEGRVAGQRPSAGTEVDAGSRVDIALAPLPVALVEVPDLSGSTREQAADELGALGLVLGGVSGQGEVSTQEPVAGTSVARGSPVRVVLAAAPGPVAVTTDTGPWTWLAVLLLLLAAGAGVLTRTAPGLFAPRVRTEVHLDDGTGVQLTEVPGVSGPTTSLRTRAGDDAPVLLEEVSR